MSDRVTCTDDGVTVRGYYPWGAKRIPYKKIKGLTRVQMTAARGRMRFWGTSNPRYWAAYDRNRRNKTEALIFDLGKFVHPYTTPDDIDGVIAAVAAHAGVHVTDGGTSPYV
ncbi:MAG TPA: hypothetical protein VGF87_00985 [Acidimicrobiales bacterium]|jgi:hypothetical protein